jgi:4-hydroxy-L-threonine phosphate dehydrogenase PdxA
MYNDASKPVVGIMMGDPSGIGPEVVAKSWASGKLHEYCRPVLVGSAAVMRQAAAFSHLPIAAQVVHSPDQCAGRSDMMDVLEPVIFNEAEIRFGHDVEHCGWASGMWLDYADQLGRDGVFDAVVMGPISSAAMDMAGTLGSIATNRPGGAYLLLRSAPLMIAHLTDHVPLREVPSMITAESVSKLLYSVDGALKRWGLPTRRIAVAGFNPHAEGEEEARAITPATQQARADGIDASGPFSPDSVFRHCIEGRSDVVLAMYHDQGHIAMKTWGFSGNSVVMLGPPYVHTTVAHGVAYELAGKGVADHSMILNAILNAAQLAAGKGFYE